MGVITQIKHSNHILAMTKKDYELIARALKGIFDANAFCLDDDQDKYSVAERMAEALATTNPRFNKERFISACGVEKPEEDNQD